MTVMEEEEEEIEEQQDFERMQANLSALGGFPSGLHSQLHSQLRREVFDGQECFEIEGRVDDCGQTLQQRRLIVGSEHATLENGSRGFLADHAWSFGLADARKQAEDVRGASLVRNGMLSLKRISPEAVFKPCKKLESVSGLAERMGADESEVSVENTAKRETVRSVESVIENALAEAAVEGRDVYRLNFDDLQMDDSKLQSLNLPANFPNLMLLSLWGTKLESLDAVLEVVRRLPSLHALWLNDTPVVKNLKVEDLMETVLEAVPLLEIFNSYVTRNFTDWVVLFYSELHF